MRIIIDTDPAMGTLGGDPEDSFAIMLALNSPEVTVEGITGLVESYTREAGVRNLEREIAAVCRKVARKVVADGKEVQITVDKDMLTELLGKARFRPRRKAEESEVGVATGGPPGVGDGPGGNEGSSVTLTVTTAAVLSFRPSFTMNVNVSIPVNPGAGE